MNLQDHKIETLPDNFYYIPSFISAAEESSLLQKIPSHRWTQLSHRRLQAHPSTLTPNNTLLGVPLPAYLVALMIPRFEALGVFNGTPHKGPNHVLINEYNSGQGIMPHEDGGAYAGVVATVSLGAELCLNVMVKPKPGQGQGEGGGEEEQQQQEQQQQEGNVEDIPPSSTYTLPTRIFQERRSLLITMGPAYSETLHGISEVEVDEGLSKQTVANWRGLEEETRERIERDGGRSQRGLRISLTYRDVRRVSGAVGKVFGGRRGGA